jgi:hypothetical protein
MTLPSCGRIGFESLSADPDAAAATVDAAVDASEKDTRLSCEKAKDDSEVALYTFNDDIGGVIVDALGTNSASTVGTVAYVDGPIPACGQAIRFSAATQGYGFIPDDPAWQLTSGSVDFWFRASSFPPELAAFLSRDGSGTTTPGHLGIFLTPAGRVGLRLQGMNAADTLGGVCSEDGAVVVNEWNHLGTNFGSAGTELWLNGTKVDAPGMLNIVTCQSGTGIGISGNTNPWTVGINSGPSADGTGLPVTQPFDGAMDQLRISAIRRDFSGPAYAKPAP